MTDCLFKGGNVFRGGVFVREDVRVTNGVFVSPERNGSPRFLLPCDRYFIFPGLADVHVHLREPGFFYKETIRTGARAAARGGYTAVCAMPNLQPVPDSPEHLAPELAAIAQSAAVRVLPYGAITIGQKGETLADMAALAPFVAGFSDDGHGVQNDEIMRAAMKEAKRLGKLIAAHCEDDSLLRGGYIHDGAYAKAHGHAGICAESEWGQIKRDLALVRETGCAYHVCHISTGESVALIRQAKREGLDVSCETAPHYLLLSDDMLQEDGRFKMNPPIRSRADREALLSGLCDGTIDMIATDHAPHSAQEKSGGLKGSLMGITGLEAAFPVLYTQLVRSGILSLEKLVDLMCTAPRRRFSLGGGVIAAGQPADFAVFELDTPYTLDSRTFLSMGKSTPFDGYSVRGRCVLTCANGRLAWSDGTLLPATEF